MIMCIRFMKSRSLHACGMYKRGNDGRLILKVFFVCKKPWFEGTSDAVTHILTHTHTIWWSRSTMLLSQIHRRREQWPYRLRRPFCFFFAFATLLNWPFFFRGCCRARHAIVCSSREGSSTRYLLFNFDFWVSAEKKKQTHSFDLEK
jgi:hypothetical protein